jgi:hypothetical protein
METQGQYEAKEKGRERRGLSHKYVSKEQRGEGVNTARERRILIFGGSERYLIIANPIPNKLKRKSRYGRAGGTEARNRFCHWKRKRSLAPSSRNAPIRKATILSDIPVRNRLSRRKAAPAARMP